MDSTERINQQLINYYGIDTITGQAMWRVVWSDDQYEKRLTKYTDSGIELLRPEVRELPKYKQWVQSKWVLENLVVVPIQNNDELAGLKVSYEPLYVFATDEGEMIFPSIEACQFVIQLIHEAKGKKSFDVAKYTEDPEAGRKELDKLEQDLFGNETDVTDSLAYGEGVVVPSNYKVN